MGHFAAQWHACWWTDMFDVAPGKLTHALKIIEIGAQDISVVIALATNIATITPSYDPELIVPHTSCMTISRQGRCWPLSRQPAPLACVQQRHIATGSAVVQTTKEENLTNKGGQTGHIITPPVML
jgi:hypothetical protein